MNIITRTLAAALVIAAVAGPAAQARPTDAHASAAQASSKAQNQQDPRAHKRVGAYTPGSDPAVSYPSGKTAPARPVPGPPTWPVNPEVIASAPAVAPSDGGKGIDYATIGLGIAGCLLAFSGIAAMHYRRTRRTHRLGAAA